MLEKFIFLLCSLTYVTKSSERMKKIAILLRLCKVRHATYKWIMRVLALERHAYFIIDTIHNTYSTYSIYSYMWLFTAFFFLSLTFISKPNTLLSPGTHKTECTKEMLNWPHMSALPWWMPAMDAVNPARPRRHATRYSKRSLCCCLSKRAVSCLGWMQFLMFKHIRKERMIVSPSHGFGSAQHWVRSWCSEKKREMLSLAQDKAMHAARLKPTAFPVCYPGISVTMSPSHRDDRLNKNLLVFASVYWCARYHLQPILKCSRCLPYSSTHSLPLRHEIKSTH